MPCLNMGSYNYLGFAESKGPCAEAAKAATYKHGNACCSSRHEIGEIIQKKIMSSLWIWKGVTATL